MPFSPGNPAEYLTISNNKINDIDETFTVSKDGYGIHLFNAAKKLLEIGKPKITHLTLDGTLMTVRQVKVISRLLAACSSDSLTNIKFIKIHFSSFNTGFFRKLGNIATVIFIGGTIQDEVPLVKILPNTKLLTIKETSFVSCAALNGLKKLETLHLTSITPHFFVKTTDGQNIINAPNLKTVLLKFTPVAVGEIRFQAENLQECFIKDSDDKPIRTDDEIRDRLRGRKK